MRGNKRWGLQETETDRRSRRVRSEPEADERFSLVEDRAEVADVAVELAGDEGMGQMDLVRASYSPQPKAGLTTLSLGVCVVARMRASGSIGLQRAAAQMSYRPLRDGRTQNGVERGPMAPIAPIASDAVRTTLQRECSRTRAGEKGGFVIRCVPAVDNRTTAPDVREDKLRAIKRRCGMEPSPSRECGG